jgi:large subunit ribosomal protein L22
MMESSARLRNNPKTNNNSGSSRKARLVADQIRGLDVDKALAILKFSTKEVSGRFEQVLLCAINNWKQQHKLDPADQGLYIKAVKVDAGKTMKRFQAAPHGRAHRIRKRTHHVVLTVASRSGAGLQQETASQEEAGGKAAVKKTAKTGRKAATKA